MNIQELFQEYTKAVAVNPILAGFSLYFAAAGSYLLRNIPLALWNKLKRIFTTEVELNNSGFYGNEFHYSLFLTWFMESPWSKWSRTLYTGRTYLKNQSEQETIVGPGVGTHFFFLNGRLFWFVKRKVESPGTNLQKEEIVIKTLGRSHVPLLDLISRFEYKKETGKLDVFHFKGDAWTRMTSIPKRSMSTVFINKEIKTSLRSTVDRFVEQPEWFSDKGFAYKLTFLLTGVPGGGKTSLVKAIASDYNRTLCIMDLSLMTNTTLQYALSVLPPKSVLLLEDIDASTSAVEKRSEVVKSSSDSVVTDLATMISGSLTLSGLLNALDGIIPLHDVLIFMSTNHPEKLDSALVRKARVDHTHNIGCMGNQEIHEFITLMYDGQITDVEFEPVIGCNVQHAFAESSESLQGFIDQLPHTKRLQRVLGTKGLA